MRSDSKFVLNFRKWIWVGLGPLNFLTFHLAIIGLFFFLNNHRQFSDLHLSWRWALLLDLALLFFFTIPHSWLLGNQGRRFIIHWVPPKLHMTIYGIHASISLLLMYFLWAPFGPEFTLQAPIKEFFFILNLISWGLMGWAILATGPLQQMGLGSWISFMKKSAVNYHIPYDGPYSFFRHPIYVAFFGMIWFIPHWDVSHLFLSLFWSGYLVQGAREKDRRLAKNKKYAQYLAKTPATPLGMARGWVVKIVRAFPTARRS